MKLTALETKAISWIARQGLEVMGGKEPKDLIADNMSWFTENDLVEDCGFSRSQVGGVMSSLHKKGLTVDAGEDPFDKSIAHWFLSETGIKEAQKLDEEVKRALAKLESLLK